MVYGFSYLVRIICYVLLLSYPRIKVLTVEQMVTLIEHYTILVLRCWLRHMNYTTTIIYAKYHHETKRNGLRLLLFSLY